jgi:AcrR family transcriptional regulator
MAAIVRVTAGLRERNKAEKLERIRNAARALFVEKGYDDTTIREIAQRADVGFGTLFSYASDKHDLLFLIFTDELMDVVEAAMREAQKKDAFLDQLLAFFRCFYRFFARQPGLSRFVLRELTFYVEGKQAERFQHSRFMLLRRLVVLTAAAQAAGLLATAENAETLARAIFSTYSTELRDWLGEDTPALKTGLARLRRMLRLHIEGFAPAAGATEPKRR